MFSRIRDYSYELKNYHLGLILVLAVLSLALLGLVVLASASQSFYKDGGSLMAKQLFRLALAFFAGTVLVFVNIDAMRKYGHVIAIFSVLLLVAVLIPGVGKEVNGAQRWLPLGPVRLEVSDVAKLALIFYLADYIAKNQREITSFIKGFVVPSSIILVCCSLIILEPDYGTTFLCACIGFGMLFLSGAKLRYLIPSIFSGCLVFFVAVLLNPVRLKRLTSFLDIEGNKMDGAYQLWQGILAFAAGGVDGVGLGKGRQQISYLPEAHTDFIFPVIGEEMGLVFTAGVVLLFAIIFLVGTRILKRAPDMFNYNLVAGVLLCIVLQAIINIGVVTGLLPTKGISLPFISYGGSNLILMFCLIGVLINCLRNWGKDPIVKATEI